MGFEDEVEQSFGRPCRTDCLVAYERIPTNWERVMTICSLLSSDQTTAIKDQFAGVEITVQISTV